MKIKEQEGLNDEGGDWDCETSDLQEERGYNPVRLPFISNFRELAVAGKEESEERVDESPQSWFERAKEYNWDSQSASSPPPLCCLQLPTHFPLAQGHPEDEEERLPKQASGAPISEAQKRHAASLTKLFQSQHGIKNIPPGQIGQLVFYKSGKVQLHLGTVPSEPHISTLPGDAPSHTPLVLDISPATPFLFEHELVALNAEQGKAFALGTLPYRLISSVDLESLR